MRQNVIYVATQYGDIEYFGVVYYDAELKDGKWHYKGLLGRAIPFLSQHQVRILDGPGLSPKRTLVARESPLTRVHAGA